MHHIAAYFLVRHWADWIANTPLAQLLQNSTWIVPTSQSIHIVSLSIVFGSALLINLRLLGIGRAERSVSELTRALVPWIYAGLVVLLFTGIVQTIATVQSVLVTPAFWWKMLMIAGVLILTMRFSRSVQLDPAKWDGRATRPVGATLLALVSLGLWIGIILCGRFIGDLSPLHV